jgi:hypothetical protein
MNREGVIGYFAGKNGVGIRIFLNHATSSIGMKPQSAHQKIFQFSNGSSGGHTGSVDEPTFKDPFGNSEFSDSDLNPHTPKNGEKTNPNEKNSPDRANAPANNSQTNTPLKDREVAREVASANIATAAPDSISIDEIVRRLRGVLEPTLKTIAVQTAQREHERTREWLERSGIPKAARVAQRESYNVLRSHGLVERGRNPGAAAVGRSFETARDKIAGPPRPRTTEEQREIAETCIALLVTQGRSIDSTLSDLSAEKGGWLLPDDVLRVREMANRQLAETKSA